MKRSHQTPPRRGAGGDTWGQAHPRPCFVFPSKAKMRPGRKSHAAGTLLRSHVFVTAAILFPSREAPTPGEDTLPTSMLLKTWGAPCGHPQDGGSPRHGDHWLRPPVPQMPAGGVPLQHRAPLAESIGAQPACNHQGHEKPAQSLLRVGGTHY